MLINEIKELINLIEDNIKFDSRFDPTLRNKMKFLAYKNITVPNYVPIAVPIIDTNKINKLEEENKQIKLIIDKLMKFNLNDNSKFLKEYLKKLEDINNKIKMIIS